MKKNAYIELLKKARKLIDSDEEYYICYALDAVKTTETTNEVEALTNWIMEMLYPSSYLNNWVSDEIGQQTYACIPNDVRDQKLRVTRLAWIDWMIDRIKANNGKIPK